MSFRYRYLETRGLEPEFNDRLLALQRRVGGEQELPIFDGNRSVEEQARRRDVMQQRGFNPDDYYAPPGESPHNYGLGADVAGNLMDAHRYSASYGLYMPMRQDPWHVEPSYVTQLGLPKDEISSTQAGIAAALRDGNFDENTMTQALQVHAAEEADAEQFNTPTELGRTPEKLVNADVAGAGGGSEGIVAGMEGNQASAVAKLEEQKSVNALNDAAKWTGTAQANANTSSTTQSAPSGQGWQNIDAFLSANGIRIGAASKGQTDGGSHAAGSYHYQGTARDYGTSGSDPQAIYNAIVPFAMNPDGPIAELFWEGGSGTDWKNGRNIGRTIGGHSDHVHVALKPGRSLSEVGGATQAAGGYQRITLQEAAVDPAFAMAQIADLSTRGAEKSYARQAPLRPLAGSQAPDKLAEAVTGRAEGETEVLQPEEQRTLGGQAAVAVAGAEGRPIATSDAPPEPLVEDVAIAGQPKPGAAGGAAGGDIDGWIRQAMQLTGVGEDQFQWIKKKAMQESGGRNILQQIKDVNSGGNEAMGPMQIIPGTFKANMVAGYGDRNNPVHSIAAAINYIKRRYKGDFRGVAMRGGGY